MHKQMGKARDIKIVDVEPEAAPLEWNWAHIISIAHDVALHGAARLYP